jgi:hypothetical protein
LGASPWGAPSTGRVLRARYRVWQGAVQLLGLLAKIGCSFSCARRSRSPCEVPRVTGPVDRE